MRNHGASRAKRRQGVRVHPLAVVLLVVVGMAAGAGGAAVLSNARGDTGPSGAATESTAAQSPDSESPGSDAETVPSTGTDVTLTAPSSAAPGDARTPEDIDAGLLSLAVPD